jgi:hypothetical protein
MMRADITGKDTVTVSHPESANLYNKEGLPASIFTTANLVTSE